MVSVAVNPPKTPVTEGSNDVAAATLPNVCKMPGPPAPFVPTPLPNVGRSGDSLSDATKKVTIEGKKVAIKGTYYMSKLSGDMASKGTGGGVVSATTEGKTKFVAPGSMNVKAEGKNIQLLGDAMTNNGSNPDNAGTLPGNIQPSDALVSALGEEDANALCQAMCDAKNDPDVTDKQKAVAKAMSGKGPLYTAKPGSNMLPEVSYRIPSSAGKGFLRLIKSATERFVDAARTQLAPASLARALNVASQLGSGNVVRWDFVQVANPAKSAIPSNVKNYVECKFPPDDYTPNQKKAMKKMKDRSKVVTVTPADCGC
jgi:uncharacterized Zn-binding protein involved in type VI secretion